MILNQLFIKITKFTVLFVFILYAFATSIIWTGVSLLDIENYNEWRIYEVLLILTIVFFGVFSFKNIDSYLNTKLILALLLIFFLGILSSYNSKYPIRAIRDCLLYISIAVSCFYLALFIKDNKIIALYTFIFMSIIPILFIIYFFFSFIFTTFSNKNLNSIYFLDIWLSQFANKRMYGDNALPIIFMIIGLFFIDFLSKYKKYLCAYLFMFVFLFMLTGGRGAFISFYLTILIGFILKPKLKREFLTIILLSFFSFIASCLFSDVLDNDINNSIFRTSSSGRSDIIAQSITLIKTNILLGIGPSHFYHTVYRLSHPHNFLLQLLVEWGILSFLIFSITLITISISFMKLFSNTDNKFHIFIILSLISFCINTNFNGAHIYPANHIYFIFILSYVLSLYFLSQQHETICSNKNNSYFFKILSLTIVFLLAFTSYQGFKCAYSHSATLLNLYGTRFWLFDSPHDDKLCQ